MEVFNSLFIIIGAGVLLAILTIVGLLSRYKKCKSNEILVVYGKTGGKTSAKCVHGGASFIIPIIQDYDYMSLKPLQFICNLEGALSSQNIRVDVPTTVTVAVSTEPTIMQNAAERLLGFDTKQIQTLVTEIVYGQMREVIASTTIEELNADRDSFRVKCKKLIGEELNKLGLDLLNINITDIRDEAGYIVALGQKDTAIALNNANIEIAKAEKHGATQIAEQKKIQNSEVAVNEQLEAVAVAEQQKIKDVSVASHQAAGRIGEIEAEKLVKEKDAELKVVEAKALEKGEVAKAQAEAKIKQEEELAQKLAEEARAKRVESELRADKIVPAEAIKEESLKLAEAYQLEIEKRAEANKNEKILIATGTSEAIALEGKGRAAAVTVEGKAEASAIEAKGLANAMAVEADLKAQAGGFRAMIEAAEHNPQVAIQFKMVQEGTFENIAREQAAAIKQMNFGNVQVLDTTKNGGVWAQTIQNIMGEIAPMFNLIKEIVPSQMILKK